MDRRGGSKRAAAGTSCPPAAQVALQVTSGSRDGPLKYHRPVFWEFKLHKLPHVQMCKSCRPPGDWVLSRNFSDASVMCLDMYCAVFSMRTDAPLKYHLF